MKKIASLLFVVVLAGCSHKSGIFPFNECPTPEKLGHFSWIQEIVKNHPNSSACSLMIWKGTYDGENVIYWDYTGPLCDTAGPLQLYNCKGEIIKTFTTTADFEKRNSDLKADGILYR